MHWRLLPWPVPLPALSLNTVFRFDVMNSCIGSVMRSLGTKTPENWNTFSFELF